MTGDIQISPDMKITSALALVHALRTAGKPVRDVYRASDGGCRISFDGWKVDAAAVDEAVAKGWLVLTYPKKSGEWWRLPEMGFRLRAMGLVAGVHVSATPHNALLWRITSGWLNALALFALLTMWWRRHLGAYELVKDVHFHDLGKLIFAFTAFWGYLTFGQYLVVWYGNLGEETHFMRLRLIGGWKAITVTAATLVFAFPFFGLMGRAAKVFLPTLAFFATASLTGMWLMRYIEVYPSAYGEVAHAPFGLWEIGVLFLYLAAAGDDAAGFIPKKAG